MPPIGDIMDLLFILFILLAIPIGIGYMLWYLLWDSSAIFRGIVKFIWKVPLFPISLPFAYLQRRYKEKAFEKKALKFVPKANEALELLKTLFLPNKIVTAKDIDNLLYEYRETIDGVSNLYKDEYSSEYVLLSSGLSSFREQMERDNLVGLMEENNRVCSAIDILKQLSIKALEQHKALIDSNHYFAHSEMEAYLASFSEFEKQSKLVLPKYAEYITDDATRIVLTIKENLATERVQHNKDFIQRELTANKTYFDTVLGQYPLDPQQRDSLVKLEDNCLVIASAGSGKTSTILGKAKYLVEKRNIDPSKVLLITYTRKAANELHERMKIDGMTCSTFHNSSLSDYCKSDWPSTINM